MITKRRIMLFCEKMYFNFLKKFDATVRTQISVPKSIPVIIINFNQLYYLKQLVDFLVKRDFKEIVIIDNASTYIPLLEYYSEISDRVTIEHMKENFGHDVYFKSKILQKKYGQGFYFLTDSDIVPNENLPDNFEEIMLGNLIKYFKKINKIGFAIDTGNIPDHYPLKEKVIKWERKFWKVEIEKDMYFANIDTTFALYKPKYPKTIFPLFKFMTAIRMGGNFTCKHGGWYLDPENLSDENIHYIKTASKSSSWKLDEQGKHASREYDPFI